MLRLLVGHVLKSDNNKKFLSVPEIPFKSARKCLKNLQKILVYLHLQLQSCLYKMETLPYVYKNI